tara:strand:+ start:132 stop:713 length:582 start_codon:yes stop_codon:yes gene_type:complete
MATQADVTNFSGTEIITLDEAKAYLRVDFTTDNDYITELIKIARLQILKDTSQVIVAQGITEWRSSWPVDYDDCIQLKYNGKVTAASVYYRNASNALVTMTEDTDYRIVNWKGLPKIQMLNTPSLNGDFEDAIKIAYSIEPNNTDSIKTLKIAMYMLIQHYYDNRSPVSYLKVDEMPLGYKSIINQYKNYIWQ